MTTLPESTHCHGGTFLIHGPEPCLPLEELPLQPLLDNMQNKFLFLIFKNPIMNPIKLWKTAFKTFKIPYRPTLLKYLHLSLLFLVGANIICVELMFLR